MPVKITVDPDNDGFIATITGEMKGADIFEFFDRIRLNPSFPEWRYQIWDYSNVEKVDYSIDNIRSFANQGAVALNLHPDLRVAVIPKKEKKSGLDRIFHVFVEVWDNYESRTFQDLPSALEWCKQDRNRS